jgi:hypothetical protein
MASIPSDGGLGDFTPARRKHGQTSWHLNGRGSRLVRASIEPGDEQNGGWSRAALFKMDARFVAAVERAISRGLERRPGGGGRERAA